MPSNFAFLTDCASSSAAAGRYGVYLDPANRIVYTRVGSNGQPLEIPQGLHLDLGWVPACTVGESLRNWMEDHEAHLGRIVGGFSAKSDRRSVHGDWTREALMAADDLRSSLQQALREHVIGTYWKVSEWWAPMRLELVEQALAARSLDAFVGAEVQRSRAVNVWIDYDEGLDHLKEVLHDRRQRLEAALSALDQTTWGAASNEHYRIDRTLGYQQEQDVPDWGLGSHDAMWALQRKIVEAVRSVDRDTVTRARMTIRSMGLERSLDSPTLLAALSAATADPAIWDALSQIRQAVMMEEDPDVPG